MNTQTQSPAQSAYDTFTNDFMSLNLATTDRDGIPNASYAPFAVDKHRNYYILVSGLSQHTSNLYHTGKASVLFIEDEIQSDQIFARRRLTYQCEAELIEHEDDTWQASAGIMTARFGKKIEHMLTLPDFRIVKLKPKSGLFVIGFGQAYRIGSDLETLQHMGGGGKGGAHGTKHKL